MKRVKRREEQMMRDERRDETKYDMRRGKTSGEEEMRLDLRKWRERQRRKDERR